MDIHEETFSLCCFTNAKEQVEYPQKIAGHYAPTERNAPASSSTARTILFRIAQTKTLPVLSGPKGHLVPLCYAHSSSLHPYRFPFSSPPPIT